MAKKTKSTSKAEPVYSVVIPMRNEHAALHALFARLIPVLDSLKDAYEIICVNDGSTDDTFAALVAMRETFSALRVIDLSRGFGKDIALTSGIEHARGQAVITMDADLQHPPETIPDFVKKWRAGFQAVYGVRTSRADETPLKRASSNAFYKLFNRLSSTPIPQDAGDFRLLDRQVVDALQSMPEHSRFMKGLFAWVGFRQIGVPYEVGERAEGTSRWPFAKLFTFALDGIFAFSTVPLRMWTWLGALAATVALLYAAYLFVRTLVFGVDVPGYASLMVAVLFFGGVQLISTGILGEYVGRIFKETKARPLYIVNRTVGFEDDPADKSPQSSK